MLLAQNDRSVLHDSENGNNNGNGNGSNGGESACDALTNTGSETVNNAMEMVKGSEWVPWAVAAGFGVLWLTKGN